MSDDEHSEREKAGESVGARTPRNSQAAVASRRLDQLSSHLKPSNAGQPPSTGAQDPPHTSTGRRKRKPRSQVEALPPDYSDILSHVKTLKCIASTPDPTNRGYIRQKTAGKLWVRERIDVLLDENSFQEIGSISGTATWKVDPTNNTEMPETFVLSNNPQGGHADGSTMEKTLYVEKLALSLKLPVVKLVDGSSGGGSVTTIRKMGYSYISHLVVLKTVVEQLNAGIPNLGAVVGPAIGLGAARVVCTHFSVMAEDVGTLFNARPKVVEGVTFEEGLSFQDLGGPMMHCTNGTIDNIAKDEEGCFEPIRTVLGYLPNCGQLEAPPVVGCDDSVDREDLALRSVIPRKKARMYNPWTIVTSVVDRGSWFEIGALWERTGITGLARLGGMPIGVISLDCEVNGGALDAQGSQKLTRLLKLCDVMNLPILQFVDIPGYAIGAVAERTATMRWGVELAKAYYATTTQIFSVITRRVFGVAGGVMLDSRDPISRVAWPSGQWGSLPLDGGIEVGHRHELSEAAKLGRKEARYSELAAKYDRLSSPLRTANAFGIEEIIDPKDTRKYCCAWVKQVYGLPMQERLADRAAGRIRPVFT